MAGEGEDDGVLFEGSPLLEHLQDVGVLDGLHISKKVASQPSDGHTLVLGLALQTWLSGALESASELLGHVLLIATGARHANTCSISLLMQSRLLSNDDQTLLAFFDESAFSMQPAATDSLPSSSSSFRRKLVFSSLLAVVLGLLLSGSMMAVVLAMLILLIITLVLSCNMLVGRVVSILDEWRRSSEQLNATLAQSLRLMQDIEVVHHGFLRPSLTGGSVRRDGSLFASASLSCTSALGTSVRNSTLLTYYAFCQLTKALIERHPLLGNVDSIDHYLCYADLNIPTLQDLGVQSADGSTMDLSHSTLKMYVNLLRNQQSECIRRLLLCFTPKARGFEFGVGMYLSMWTLLKADVKLVKEQHCQLQASLDYMHSRLSDPPAPRSLAIPEKSSSNRFSHLLYLSHNLQLHLHAALERSELLRTALANESSHDDDDDAGALAEISKTAQACVDLVEVSVSSSQSYITDVSASLTALRRVDRAPDTTGEVLDWQDEAMTLEADPASRDDKPAVGESDDEERVYEATVDSSDESENETRKLTPSERRAEIERRQREAEEPLRMVRELKAVLASRQANAVLRKSAAAATSTSASADASTASTTSEATASAAAVSSKVTESSTNGTVSDSTAGAPDLSECIQPESVPRAESSGQCMPGPDDSYIHRRDDITTTISSTTTSSSTNDSSTNTQSADALAPLCSNQPGDNVPSSALAANKQVESTRVDQHVDDHCSATTEASSLSPTHLFATSSTPSSMAQMAAMLALRGRSAAGLGKVETFGSDESDESDKSEEDV
ncbi:serine-rich adhesin for platelets-like isoform X2 [Sycon ciliatum]|uniref:serine-rich adhesin for platelets-like isoform X2 n=1 Tax=Sycon ciliatum TaxID=27933 RepID=UPI0031F6B3E3